ncbi:hypothetical protein P9112_009915 [Eukaryota sp. TZLM1-RC]
MSDTDKKTESAQLESAQSETESVVQGSNPPNVPTLQDAHESSTDDSSVCNPLVLTRDLICGEAHGKALDDFLTCNLKLNPITVYYSRISLLVQCLRQVFIIINYTSLTSLKKI